MTEAGNEIHEEHGLLLAEKLPLHPSLTVDDIRQIAVKHYGLRTTDPKVLDEERREGVAMGDFILLHDVSSFLGIDADKLRQTFPDSGKEQIPDEIKRDLIQEAFTKPDSPLAACLTGLDALPARYTQALEGFFTKHAIPALGVGVVMPEMTMGEYINRLDKLSPSLLIVEDQIRRLGYDQNLYQGFSKRGRAPISPDMIVDTAGIGEAEKALLTRRYASYLDQPAGTLLPGAGRSRERYLNLVNNDVATMLVGKTVGMVKPKSV